MSDRPGAVRGDAYSSKALNFAAAAPAPVRAPFSGTTSSFSSPPNRSPNILPTSRGTTSSLIRQVRRQTKETPFRGSTAPLRADAKDRYDPAEVFDAGWQWLQLQRNRVPNKTCIYR